VIKCPQNARGYRKDIDKFYDAKRSGKKIIAIVAPAYISDFHPASPGQVASALKKVGFSEVHEVAFGAEICTLVYLEALKSGKYPALITSPCPTMINYVTKWEPDLLKYFAPIDSPMMVEGRLIKSQDPNSYVVFLSPCIGKKTEIDAPDVKGIVNLVLTYEEIRDMFKEKGINYQTEEEILLDGYQPNVATSFPISGGLARTAADYMKKEYHDLILDNTVAVIEGHERSIEYLKMYMDNVRKGKANNNPVLLDLLYCEGCIMGPATRTDINLIEKKNIVAEYTKNRKFTKINSIPFFGKEGVHKQNTKNIIPLRNALTMDDYKNMAFKRTFTAKPVSIKTPTEAEIKKILAVTNKFTKKDEKDCGACGYESCRAKAIASYNGLVPNEYCLMYEKDENKKNYNEAVEMKARNDKSIKNAQQMIDQIYTVVESLSNNIVKISEETAHIKESIENDMKLADELNAKRTEGEETTKKVKDTVSHLTETSEKIVIITETINNISSQTNLLALNAAIEAARAGENGKGFAVVANEVKSLADETAKSSSKANELITNMTEKMKQTVDNTDVLTDFVNKEGDLIESSYTNSKAMAEKISSIDKEVEMLSAAAEEMLATVTDIKNNINETLNQ
jgi:iron only hydrogenase large subunit-like protein